jgi:predicted ATP-grasp superfamily ATP-dependent carboligase
VYSLGSGCVSAVFSFPDWCRDVPNPGTRFAPGDPVCTVHAAAPDRERAVTLVRRRQAALQRVLHQIAA